MLEAVLRILSIAAPILLLFPATIRAETLDVSLCSVLQMPEKYNHQELTMTVGYRAGFEWQELVCAPCNAKRTVWVEFDADVKDARKLGKFTGRFDSIYRVRVRGVFVADGGHYGHSNGYDYLFLIKEVLSAKRLWQMTPHQSKVSPAIAAAACRP